MDVHPIVWVVSLGVAGAVLLFDVIFLGRRPHVPNNRETGRALGLFVALALVFCAFVWIHWGHEYGTQFLAGWLTEYSLSVDNLFVFLIIMTRFQVPAKLQQEALLIGIVIALVLRGGFIAIGAAAIDRFSWVFYLFGGFLVYTAVNLARQSRRDSDHDGTEDYHENRLMATLRRRLPATESFDGTKLVSRENGRRLVTPMLLVILALGTTDLLFALDSIPAIYGLTQEPYLVLMANIFALMGLRQLYFLIGGLLKRLVYLSLGLSVLLGFIGLKLVLHAMHANELRFINGGKPVEWAPELPILVSLGAILVILAVTTVASLAKSRSMKRSAAE